MEFKDFTGLRPAADDLEEKRADIFKPPLQPMAFVNLNGLSTDPVRERAVTRDAVTVNPDQFKQKLDASRKTGLPLSVVEQDTGALQNALKAQDLMNSLKDSPYARKWFGVPENAKMAHDDADSLTRSEAIGKATYGRVLAFTFGFNRVVDRVTKGLSAPQDYVSENIRGLLFGDAAAEEYRKRAEQRPGLATAIMDVGDVISEALGLRDAAAPKTSSYAADPLKAKEKAGVTKAVEEKLTSWDDVKDDALTKVLPFIVEQGIISIPDMAMAIVSLPVYAASRTEQIAAQRAKNDGRTEATFGDFINALPAATASAFLERLGARGMLGLDDALKEVSAKGVAKASGKAAVKEGVTEFAQGIIEQGGETIGTKKPFNIADAVDEAIGGMVAGSGLGGSVRGVTASVEATVKARVTRRRADQLRELNGLNSNLRERDPEAWAEYQAGLMEEYGVDRVRLSDEGINILLQEVESLPPQQADLFRLPDNLMDGSATGSGADLRAEDFWSLPKETIDKLAEHISFDVNEVSASEAQEIADLTEMATREEFIKEVEQTMGDLPAADALVQEIEGRLMETGGALSGDPAAARAAAQQMAAVFSTMARRTGVPLETIQRRFLPRIERVTGAGLKPSATTLEQAQQGFADPRIPELEQAARDRSEGRITQEAYQAVVDQYKPVLPYESVPEPATDAEMRGALASNKVGRLGKGGEFVGQGVGLRLDIPAYTQKGVWVPTIHNPQGKPVAHEAAARITNATFTEPGDAAETAAGKVGRGEKGKAPFAQINGTLESVDPAELKAAADAALNDPAWTQVGYDPRRHTFFYDRKTQQPILSADEVIQVGPLVLAKNAQFGDAGTFLFQSAAPLQEQPLTIVGTGPGGRVLNRDIGKAFTDRHMAAYGRALDPEDPADYAIMLDSLLADYAEQSRQPDSGDSWYTDDIAEAVRLTEYIYPELANPQFRDLFLTATALLSPQQKPGPNWENAILALRSWKETGRIDLTKPSGAKFGVNTKGLQLLQYLIDTKGLEGAMRWVQEEHTGREMAEIRRDSGLFVEKPRLGQYTPSELNLRSSTLGIYMFGPKVGDFMQNSVGIDQNAVTVDLWAARSYNRYVGRLLDTPDGDLVGDVRGAKERNHIKRLIRDAAEQAGIDPSAMQAALWYFEQRLYRSHGVKAVSQNFSGAAETALKSRGLEDALRTPVSYQQDAVGDAGKSPTASPARYVATEGERPGRDIRAGAVGRGELGAGQEGVSAAPLQPLPGAPKLNGEQFGPIPELVSVAEAYAEKAGIRYTRQPVYVPITPSRSERIAQAYEDAKHEPTNPDVRRAYRALITQTRAQYDALIDAGYTFTFFDNDSDPYDGNPWNAMRDLRDNKTMAVYSTLAGYGTGETFDPSGHMMLEDTGLTWKDQSGNNIKVLANDLFRAVHDAFGHGLEGAGFRARGEENAWQAHVRLFTGDAVKAITTETRGQNSWLNYGPYGEQNRTASLEDTVFAEQKMALLPSWVSSEGTSGLYGLPVNEDGTVTLTHFSETEGLTQLDPSYHGTGMAGDEGARKSVEGWVDRTYFGVSVGKEGGYVSEFPAGTPSYEAQVPADSLYDYQQDPDGLMLTVQDQAITHRRPNGDHLYDLGKLNTLYENAISDAGYEGYFNNAMQGLTVAKFTPTEVTSTAAAALSQQQEGVTARGSIDIGSTEGIIIRLYDAENLSTFLHESGHLYLEMLGAFAEGADAPQQIKDDFSTVLKWLGVGSRAEIGREQHERWAETYEAYLREGKAPSEELRSAFAKFTAWLTTLYRRISRTGSLPRAALNKDISDVMDRLLASDEQIAVVRDEMRMAPMFKDAEAAGMTEAEFTQYKADYEAAREAQQDELTQSALAEIRRERTKWWNEELSRESKRILDALNEDPVWRARSIIQQSALPNGDPLPEVYPARLKLNKKMAAEYGYDLPGGNQLFARDGVNPERAAQDLGYPSADQLLRELSELPKSEDGKFLTARQFADRQAREYMLQQHGDLMDAGQMHEEALSKVHSRRQAQIILDELRLLSRKAGRTNQVSNRAARTAAENTMREKTIAQLGSPTKYLNAERRFAMKAAEAVIAGDIDAALRFKTQQLLNFHMYRQARDLRAKSDKMIARMADYSRRKFDPRKVHPEYIDQVKALLGDINFSGKMSSRRFATLSSETLQRWADQQSEKFGASFHISPELDRALTKQNVRDFTFVELEGMHDTARSLVTQGRRYSDAETAQFDQMVRNMGYSIDANATKTVPRKREAGKWDKFTGFVRLAFAEHRTILSLSEELDGYETGGPVYTEVFQRIKQADDAYIDRSMKAAKAINDILSAYTRKERLSFLRKKRIPEINDSLSLNARLAFALNMGNPGNVSALKEEYTDAQIDAVLATLTDRDWDVVESIWGYIDTYWEDLSALEKRTTGVSPAKVSPSPFTLPSGRVIKGGYYPLVADPNRSARGKEDYDASNSLKHFSAGGRVKTSTKHGSTIERKGFGDKPVWLDLRVLFEHVDGVIRDIEMREAVADTSRIIRSKPFSEAVTDAKGSEFYGMFNNWLEHTVAASKPPTTTVEKISQYLRTGSSIAEMGLSVRTVLMQPFGYTSSIALIGEKYAAKGMLKFATQRGLAAQEVMEASAFMRNRSATFNREVREANRWLGTDSLKNDLVTASFWGIQKLDMAVSIPTWIGAYDKAKDEGMNHDNAVDYADNMVARTQGSGLPRNMADIQQGAVWKKMFTMFYSYFGAYQNMQTDLWKQTSFRNPAQALKFAKAQIWLTVVPSLLVDALFNDLFGGDDDDEIYQKIAGTLLRQATGGVVFLRDAVNAATTGFNYQPTPAGNPIKELANLSKQLGQNEVDAPLVKSLIMSTGYMLHIPGARAGARATSVLMDDGDTFEFDEFESWWRLLVTGPKRN